MRDPLDGVGVAAALAGGCLLALMTQLNGDLARHAGALFASWTAHGLGGLAAVALLLTRLAQRTEVLPRGGGAPAPAWAYAGGLAGAATVIMTSLAVNSPLALTGTLAFGLVGQAAFSLTADRFGLFGVSSRAPQPREFAGLALVVAGCLLMLLAAKGIS
jgi:bacterial/archaeal transporter family-2 protein